MLALEKQRGAQQTATTRDLRGPLGTCNPPRDQHPHRAGPQRQVLVHLCGVRRHSQVGTRFDDLVRLAEAQRVVPAFDAIKGKRTIGSRAFLIAAKSINAVIATIRC